MATKTNSQRVIEARKKREEERKNSSSNSYSNSDRVKKLKYEREIGFDTFESDLANTNTTLSGILGGWQTQETMANVRSAVESMYKRTNDYQTYIQKYQPEAKHNLGEISGYYKSVLDNWDNLAGVYGQYKDADSYAKETAKMKELTSMSKDELASHLQDKDSIAYTTYGGQDITWKSLFDEKEHAELATSKEGAEGWKKYLADVENETKTALESTNRERKWWENVLQAMSYDTTTMGGQMAMAVDAKRNDTSYMNPTDEWTQEEQNIFGAYYLQDPEKAYEYATNVNNQKNIAKENEQKQAVANSATSGFWAGAGHTLGSIASAPLALADYLDDLTSMASGRPILSDGFLSPFEYSQEVQGSIGARLNEKSGTINENVPVIGGKGLGDLYGVGTSIAQSALSGYALGGIGTMVSYFGQGASAGIDEALSRGATDEQAMLYGMLVGAGEGISEKIGVDNMFKLGSADTVKGFLKNVLKQAGSEGIEEGISSIISEVSDRIVMQDKSVFDNAVRTYMTQGMSEEEAKKKAWSDTFNSIAFDAVAGAVSGGVHGGIQTAIQSGTENRMNKKVGSVIRENETMDDLKNLASELGGDSYQKYIELLDSGKISDAKLGKLFNAVGSDTLSGYESARANDVMRSVANKANELGDSKNSGIIASAIQKQKAGQKLSSEERTALKTDTAQAILAEGVSAKHSETSKNALKRIGQVDSIITPKTVEEKAVMSATKEAKTQAQETQTRVNEMVKAEGREDISFYSESMEQAKAEAFNKIYDGKTNLESYADSFELAYTYGKNKIGVSEALKNKGVLTEAQALKAYEAGNIGRAIEKQKTVDTINKQYSTKTFAKGKFDDSIIDYNGNTEGKVAWKDLGVSRQNAIKFVKAFSEVTGVNVKLITSTVNENGKRIGENGRYEASTNTIYIDAYAGSMDASVLNDAIIPTVSHEVTHWMKAKAPSMYQKMQDYVLETLTLDGKKTLNEMIAEEKARMKQAHPDQKVTDDDAIDELVARGTEDMLANSDKVRKMLAKMSKTEQNSFIAKVKETFENIMNWVNDLLKQYKSNSKEAELLRQYKERMKELSKMWDATLAEAIQTNQSMIQAGITDSEINAVTEKVGVGVDTETESAYPAPQMSERTWTESEYVQDKETAVNALVKAIGVTKAEAENYIDNLNGIAKMIADNRMRLDYEASPNRSAFVSNAEYGGSIDFSTICKKRRLFTGTFEAVQEALPNTALTAEEVLKLRDMMKKKGYEVSCGLCYVEGSRANMGQYTKQFIERYKATNPKYVPNMAEMNTATGQEKIRKEHPEVYEAYEYFMNHYGRLNPTDKAIFASQQKPKMYQMATEYNGEILKEFGKGKDVVSEKNENGGLRLQSFSDFEIIHLIDSMQVIMDMSRVGLAGQAYTKVPDFAWALGDTGLKINLSLIAKGVDENGRLILDEVEGMKESDAMALRNRYSDNVGTIIVVFDDQQLISAMADERIDYIIPYHRSQWKTDQYEMMGLPKGTKDFTMFQNEAYIEPVYNKSGKKQRPSNYMPNAYWDFSKSGKENAENYLKMCAENNRRPKFYNLLVDNHDGSYSLQPDGTTDGYWKLLIDFKMYNNEGQGSPQNPVTPDFNMQEAERMLNEYTGGHSNFPVAEDVVDKFVDDYKKEHPQAQYADRDSYAPTFYSQMGKVVSDIKQNKLGANDVIPYLRGKGVKAEEIKWSGIEEFLDGKKSVTKAELEEFVEGSMLQIEEETLATPNLNKIGKMVRDYMDVSIADYYDDDGALNTQNLINEVEAWHRYGNLSDEHYNALMDSLFEIAGKETKWEQYIINGGNNYRELLFKMPKSEYSNSAMESHWGRSGVLAHARIQDIATNDGKMLFIEEIQSDWHNEGQKRGYYEDGKLSKILARKEFVKTEIQKTEEEIISRITEEMTGKTDTPREFAEEFMYTSTNKMQAIVAEKYGFSEQLQNLRKYQKELYSELRNLNGELQTVYNQTPDAPFRDNYHEYVLKRLIRMASEEGYNSIGWTTGKIQERRWSSEYAEGYRIEYDQDIPKFLRKYGKKWGAEVGKTKVKNNEVWQMTIPDSMKNSVLYEGQAQYSDRNFPNNAEEIAKEHFGTTKSWEETGYLLKDGTQLDFSGRHWTKYPEYEVELPESFFKGKRDVEHYEIAEAFPEYNDVNDMGHRGEILNDFLERGNIRIVGNHTVELYAEPTAEQYAKLREYFSKNVGESAYVGIGRKDSLSFDKGTNASQIIDGIKDYFAKNVANQSDLMRFHTQYSDRDYMDAVNRGDMETAQKMVDEVAKKAGYTIKAYHGSRHIFNVFAKDKRGTNTRTKSSEKWFFAGDMDTANSYYPYGTMKELARQNPKMWKESDAEKMKHKGKLYSLYLKMENPLVVDVAGYDYNAHRESADAMMEFVEQAERDGNDGIILYHVKDNQLRPNEEESTVYMFKESTQAKLADPVTYDDNGNVIPLSERFNTENEDIRYSDRDSEGNQLTEAQAEFFKDSKVRDENGNLLALYHGTNSYGFTVFNTINDREYGSHFGTKESASRFSEKMYKVYLNITNPITLPDIFGEAYKLADYVYLLHGHKEKMQGSLTNGVTRKLLTPINTKSELPMNSAFKKYAQSADTWIWEDGSEEGAIEVAKLAQEYLKSLGYDGVVYTNQFEDEGSTSYMVLDSNQIKNTDNTNPTSDADIRYSDRDIDAWLDSLSIDDIIADLQDMFWDDTTETPKKQRMPRRVDEVKKRLDAIGLTFNGTKSLAWTDERIEKYLSGGWYGSSNPNYAQAYIAYVTPQQFLNLTAGAKTSTVDMIENESASYGEVDFNKLGDSSPMFLQIEEGKNKAEVTGHEGRHRMYLLGKAGFERIPVLLFDYTTKYGKTAKDSLKLTAQRYNEDDFISKTRDTVINDLVPFSNGNKDLIIQKFGSGAEADIHYSDRDYTSVYELMGEKDTLDEENRKLKADIEKLKATIGSEDVKITRFRSLADYLKKQAGSQYSREALGDALKELYNYIQTTDDLKWYNVMAKAEEIANEMMNLNVPVNYFREVMNDIRQDKVSLSPEQYAEAEKLYGNYGNLHKALFGRVNLTKNGKLLEEQWKDWSKAFPMVFKADISAIDMVKELRDTVDALKNTSAVMGEYERQEAIRHLGMEVYNQFWNIASDSSEAVRKEKVAHRQMMEELRKEYQKRQAEKTLHPVGEVALKYEKLLKDTIKRDRAEMKRIRELGNKRMEEYKERAEVRATIQKITKNALTLNEWFVKNSKDKHIPEDMKGAVVQLIDAIDFSSKQLLGIGGVEERRNQPTANDLRLSKALSRLYEVADEMKDNQTEDTVFMELDLPDFAVDILKNLSHKGLVLNTMTLEELKALDVLMSTLKKSIVTANKNFVLAQNETRERVANRLIHDADSLAEKKADNTATNFLEYQNATPYYMLKRLGTVGEQIFNVLMDAQEQLVFLEEEIINFVKKTVDGKKIKEWSEEVHEIKILDAKRSTEDNPKYKTIKMTTAQIMSMYSLYKRESAKLHLEGGGIRMTDIKDGAFKTIKDTEGASLSKSDIYDIISRLTVEQKRVADALQKFMSETGAEWGNKVTMARWDIKQFGEENYFPMATVAQDGNLDNIGRKDNSIYRLLNMSFTKELTPRANNQLIIGNIFDVFAEHMTDMAKYATHALPLLDTMKILGYNRKDFIPREDGKRSVRHETISVAKSIRRAFGDNGYRYIIHLLKDLNGVEITPRDEALTKTLMSNYKISAVGGNLRVALLQGTAFVKAGLVMNPKYLVKALATNGLEGIKKAVRHSGIALWKSKGHYDLNIARSVTSEIKQDESFVDKFREFSLKGAEWGDKITWGYLWNACEFWAKENTPYSYNSAQFNKAVADKLREIIVKTQVVDSTLTRSQMMRGKSAMVQTLTAFMSESTMTYNMVADAFFEWSLDARKEGHSYKSTFTKHGRKFATTASVYALTAFATALAGASVDAVRDDDEDKEFDEKYLENLLENLGDNLNPFANLPIAKDIVSIAQGYSPSRFDEQSFTNLFSGVRKWMKVAEGEGNVYSATYKTLQGMSQLTGLPVSNMVRDVVAMWNTTIGEMYPHLKIEQ